MPTATSYPILGSTEDKEIEKAFNAELLERKVRFDRAWKYYEGEHDLQLEKQKDGRNDNVTMNEVGNLVDKTVSFLIGDGIQFKMLESGPENVDLSIEDSYVPSDDAVTDVPRNEVTVSDDSDTEGGPELSDDERAVLDLLTKNRDLILLYNIALIGSVEGHCVMRVTPADEKDKEKIPKLNTIKGEYFSAFWDPFDMTSVIWYRLQHLASGTGKRIDYVKGKMQGDVWDHDAPVWTEVTYAAEKISQVGATPINQGDTTRWERVKVVEWPYEWAPIIEWQNLPNPSSFYGRNDIRVAIKLNDQINFLMSNAMRIVKHYGSPRTVGIGFSGQDIQMEAGGMITVPKSKSDVDIFNLEMSGDIQTALNLYDVLRFSLWQSGGMIDPKSVKDTVGHLTNFGLRVMFLDSIKTTDKKHLLYEEGLRKVVSCGMQLMGRSDPEDRLDIVWSDVLPTDTGKAAEVLLQELDKGIISKQTYRELRGFDHYKEERRIQEEKDRSGAPQGEDLLNMLMQNNRNGQEIPPTAPNGQDQSQMGTPPSGQQSANQQQEGQVQ